MPTQSEQRRGHAPSSIDRGAIRVVGLTVEAPGGLPIVDDVSFTVAPGEILGIVGESGSGKTTTATALLGFTTRGARITAGRIEIAGAELDGGDERAARSMRGRLISYVPQNPGTALNPAVRIGKAVGQMVSAHDASVDSQTVTRRVMGALRDVGLPDSGDFVRRFPHQLSGGQQQRVCIATAVAGEPPVVILDEPTTGLDTVSQSIILDTLTRLRDEHRIAMVYVTHDLAVVGRIADRIAVMYNGVIVETGPTADVLTRPRHPYTRGLLRATPDHHEPVRLTAIPGVVAALDERQTPCVFAPRCRLHEEACDVARPVLQDVSDGHSVACRRVDEISDLQLDRALQQPADNTRANLVLSVRNLKAEHRSHGKRIVAAHDVSFDIGAGECVALVGESGSGKTTIARALAGLHPLAGGEVLLRGQPMSGQAAKRTREQRRLVQIVFQNPKEALNPRQRVSEALIRPARLLRGLSEEAAMGEASRLMDLVRLPKRTLSRYPSELSGGEQQRIGIARALAADPALLICDEITSALDVSVQAAVLELLEDLRRETQLGMLLITHDLGVVSSVAQRVVVLERGVICEQGPTTTVLETPAAPYTRRLLEVAPSLSSVRVTT